MSGALDSTDIDALEWLEQRDSPIVAAPLMTYGQSCTNFVPNNDLDAQRGDPRRIGAIRTEKLIRPQLFDARVPLLYAWVFDIGEDAQRQANAICALAEKLYQFGRGVDMAWAWGEVLDDQDLEPRLSQYPGIVFHPSDGGAGRTLACPTRGSLTSLAERYAANSRRFETVPGGRSITQNFRQQPKPRFRQVAYESPPSRQVYELRERSPQAAFAVWPLARASQFVVALRDGAAERLQEALPDRSAEIERILVGRKADGADNGPTSLRLRILPLPSIGHYHADHGIRRVLIEVPAGCPLSADDVHWAFSGLELAHPQTKEYLDFTPSHDDAMLAHYGIADADRSRLWRTVTPAALPASSGRRWIDPARVPAEAKAGAERAAEQVRAAAAVSQALRHAEVRARAETIRVQREPFDSHGERVEEFAPETRFPKERLWHAEITFDTPITGPLIIGDGRFLGLGVMAPVRRILGIHAFVVEAGLTATPQSTELTQALRRAVMARVQEAKGARGSLPTFFSGHERDGSPAQTERHSHLTFMFDPGASRLLIVAPHIVERRVPTSEEGRHLGTLEQALVDFHELRAGSAGRLTISATSIDFATDRLFTASRIWESVTPYQVTRHAKKVGAAEALSTDIRTECRRRGLPEAHVTSRQPRGIPGVGLVSGARLTFKVAVKGPIILGRSRHLGGGLFEGRSL